MGTKEDLCVQSQSYGPSVLKNQHKIALSTCSKGFQNKWAEAPLNTSERSILGSLASLDVLVVGLRSLCLRHALFSSRSESSNISLVVIEKYTLIHVTYLMFYLELVPFGVSSPTPHHLYLIPLHDSSLGDPRIWGCTA